MSESGKGAGNGSGDRQTSKGGNSARVSAQRLDRQQSLRNSLSRDSSREREQDPGSDAPSVKDDASREGVEAENEGGVQEARGSHLQAYDGGAESAAERGSEAGSEAGKGKDAARGRGGASIRMTVDLPEEQHRYLTYFRARSGSDRQRVVRALLRRMESDEDLAEAILRDLVEERLREASGG